MSIENTQTPASMNLTAMLLLATGDTDAVIGNQERAGQRQVVHSQSLPTTLHSPRAEFEALGFTFGEPDRHDPLFAPATLPEGWTREGSDHAMWSYIIDPQGRRRASIFYKAAFYDRDAFMSLTTVYGYLGECVRSGTPIATDDTWATRAAVREAALAHAKQAEEGLEVWRGAGEQRAQDGASAKYIAQYAGELQKWTATAVEYAD
jgi:hypothetical protein